MPADFSALIDTLLVLAGLVLVATGLVMFIYSKTSTQASSVEAFGIKLNVTHPSLILVLAGVGLMLAPRLLPGLPGKADDKPAPAVVAETDTSRTTVPVLPASSATAPALPPASSLPAADSPPPKSPAKAVVAPAMRVSRAEKAQPPTVAVAPKKPEPQTAETRPVAPPTAPAPAAAPLETAVPAPPAAKPARPTLVYAALGLPSNHGFWSGETRASYTRRVRTVLQTAARDVLRMEPRGLELSQSEFDAWWSESSAHPRSRELCAASHSPRALLFARTETPYVYTSIESAFWPELRLRLFVCANQRLYQQQKTLSPHNGDAWPFSTELNIEVERFVRAYRADLTD